MIARQALARDLERARQRTLTLTAFDDAELHRQYNPLMSPLVWDLAHIGQQEELWLLRDGNPDRTGMLLCGDIPAAFAGAREVSELDRDMLEFAYSAAHVTLRQQLGLNS